MPELSQASKEAVEQVITYDELETVLMETSDDRSPGLDGFPNEFWKVMFPLLGSSMVELYNEILDRVKLSESMEEGVVRLLSSDHSTEY